MSGASDVREGGLPTRVRYAVLSVATANAFLLYLDRICMGAVLHSVSFQKEMALSKERIGDVLASFFLAYALGQLPAGWMADRFGSRRMLVVYLVLWSACTSMTGLAGGIASLVAVRFLCGLAEAGAYPASGRLIVRWFPRNHRGRANSVVAFGGRVGNSLALGLTAGAIAAIGAWRPVLWAYGAIGIGLAWASWKVFRDDPVKHPRVNEAERKLIEAGSPPSPEGRPHFPGRALIRNVGLWTLSLGAIGMNLGWAFLITWLPDYLTEVHGLDPVSSSRYVSIAMICGMAGMLFGGWWCDALTRWFGPRWGRRLPVLIGSGVAMVAYLACPRLGGPRAVVVACAIVAFASDSITPSLWTLGQDIGGRHSATAMAWCNMWGNLGASAVSKLIPFALASSLHRPDWREVFWLCAGGFVVLGLSILLVDSTRSLEEQPVPGTAEVTTSSAGCSNPA